MGLPFLKYQCTGCELKFEALVALDKIDEARCAVCDAPAHRIYEGKCSFGMKAGGPGSGGCDCGGDCASCHGCAK